MDLNGIRLTEGISHSTIKRRRKQNMQMIFLLKEALRCIPGLSSHSTAGLLCTQEDSICGLKEEGEKNSVYSVRTSTRPNESVRIAILVPINVSGGLHAKSR